MTGADPTIKVRAFGFRHRAWCSEHGWLDFVEPGGDGRDYVWEHRRYEHPNEDEATADRVREVEHGLPGCHRCGLEGHESADCPHVRPDLLKDPRDRASRMGVT